MDAKTGQVLYERNAKKRMYPASITKIITGIMALESGRLEEEAVTSKRARWAEGTRIYLAQDEKKPLKEIVYGLMMNSGNDAAIVIAEHLGGTVESFAEQMNGFVKGLGANQSNFQNPHGLFAENHYTTAYDMAVISRYAMQNESFRKIVGTKKRPWIGEEWESSLVNHNKLLWRYEGATGIKNGYVSKSGNTLVASAQRGGTELITVSLKASGSEKVYADTIKLFDYGFQNYETKRLFAKGKRFETDERRVWEAAEDVYYTVKKNETFSFRQDNQGNVTIDSGEVKEVLTGKLVLIEEAEPPEAMVQPAAAKQQPTEVELDEKEPPPFPLLAVSMTLLFCIALIVVGLWIRKDIRSRE